MSVFALIKAGSAAHSREKRSRSLTVRADGSSEDEMTVVRGVGEAGASSFERLRDATVSFRSVSAPRFGERLRRAGASADARAITRGEVGARPVSDGWLGEVGGGDAGLVDSLERLRRQPDRDRRARNARERDRGASGDPASVSPETRAATQASEEPL